MSRLIVLRLTGAAAGVVAEEAGRGIGHFPAEMPDQRTELARKPRANCAELPP